MRRRFLLLSCALAVVTGLLYAPALTGPFISDDVFYIEANAYIQDLDLDSALAILDPKGEPAVLTLNYAPVHLYAHALEWAAFGRDTRGYHVVNLLLHGIVSLLFYALLRSTGLGPGAAGLGASFFLLHPANVETVAWIFQLKTLASVGLALAALLLARRRPALGCLLFALALLTKISAAFALPVFAALVWTDHGARRPRSAEQGTARWLWVWLVVFVAISIPVWGAIDRTAIGDVRGYASPADQLRSIVAIAWRYLVMAATSHGVSAFQEPAPVTSWLDLQWWLGLLAVAWLGFALMRGLRERRMSAVYLVLALAAFVPVSQIVPFRYPIADHYLYAILPGLIGACLHAWPRLYAGLPTAMREHTLPNPLAGRWGPPRSSTVSALGSVLLGVLALGFAVQVHERAGLWRSAESISQDAARHYPDGLSAHLLRAYAAARSGDGAAAAAALHEAHRRGFNAFGSILGNPSYASVRTHPAFEAVMREIARSWLVREDAVESPSEIQLTAFANAHCLLGDLPACIDRLERALALQGTQRESIARQLAERRLELRLQERLGR